MLASEQVHVLVEVSLAPAKNFFYTAVLKNTIDVWRHTQKVQGVLQPTKPGSSLIIPKPMKILQRDLNRSTFVGEK
jgi:hypothetical protein